MIRSFKHKGLMRLFYGGSTSGVKFEHIARIRLRLGALNAATKVDDLNLPGYRLHKLSGDRSQQWAINVSANWRITFEFYDGHAYVVNYEDYH